MVLKKIKPAKNRRTPKHFKMDYNDEMDNNDDIELDDYYVSLSRSLFHLRFARISFRQNLGINYPLLVNAANDNTKQILVFIDCDELPNENGFLRNRIYEAAQLFLTFGRGQIYAMTTQHETDNYILQYNVFSRVFTGVTMARKIGWMNEIFTRENAIHDSTLFVFGAPEFLAGISIPNRHGDVLVDISGLGDYEDVERYSMVDYILFYVAVSRFLQHMQQEVLI